MKYLKTTEKLDAVLNYYNTHKDRDASASEVYGFLKLTSPGNFSVGEVNRLIRKLVRERHIIKTIPNYYKITLEGVLFLEQGGYIIQRRSNYVKRQYLRMAHRSENQGASLLLWVLAIAAILIGCLLLKYAYHNFNWKIPF